MSKPLNQAACCYDPNRAAEINQAEGRYEVSTVKADGSGRDLFERTSDYWAAMRAFRRLSAIQDEG